MSQELDDNLLNLVKQKGFYPCEYINDFEKNKELPSKEKFCKLLSDIKTSDKEYEHALNVWKKFENNQRLSQSELKMWCQSLF